MLNVKSLLTKILNTMVFTTGGTANLGTSFQSSKTVGSSEINGTTIPAIVADLWNRPQTIMGSCYVGTAYTNGGVTIPVGWYNILCMNRDITTTASTQLCALLFGMTVGDKQAYYVYSNDGTTIYISAADVDNNRVTKGTMTNKVTTYYQLNGTSGTHYYYLRYGNLVVANFNVYCVNASGNRRECVTGLPKPVGGQQVKFPLVSQSSNGHVAMGWVLSTGAVHFSGGGTGEYIYGSVAYLTS